MGKTGLSHFLSFATLGMRMNLWHVSTDAIDEARSSLIEHDRLAAYMKAGDTLRARDAVSFHVEEAAAQIRRAGAARIESYPIDNGTGVPFGQN
jgi:DNA-binding GntR family transcriptional regulator